MDEQKIQGLLARDRDTLSELEKAFVDMMLRTQRSEPSYRMQLTELLAGDRPAAEDFLGDQKEFAGEDKSQLLSQFLESLGGERRLSVPTTEGRAVYGEPVRNRDMYTGTKDVARGSRGGADMPAEDESIVEYLRRIREQQERLRQELQGY